MRAVLTALIAAGVALGIRVQASASENQLVGIRMGRQAEAVIGLYGNPDRTSLGGAAPLSAAGASLAPSAAAAISQGYRGNIAGMRPEDYMNRVLGALARKPAAGSDVGAALAPGQPAGGPPPAMTWVYERPDLGIAILLGLTEEGRVDLICIGDDKPLSITRGGKRPPFAGAKTARGIRLGDTFKKVVLTYGFPEFTEVMGDEVLLSYFSKQGVLFTVRQNSMRVTSILIKSLDE